MDGNNKDLELSQNITINGFYRSAFPTMENVLKWGISDKLQNNSVENIFLIDDTESGLLLFQFQDYCSFEVERFVTLFGVDYVYLCHLEGDRGNQVSCFGWEDFMFGSCNSEKKFFG